MCLIFVMSTGVGSSAHTSRIIGPLLKWLIPSISPEALELVHTLIRKGGHLTEYAVLALLVLRAEYRSRPADRPPPFYRAAFLATLICAAYATTDEFHQSFVPGRGASAYDVAIDTTGGVAALAAAAGWRRLRRRE
jgi:VanZ family protein